MDYTGGIGDLSVGEVALSASGFLALIGKLAWDRFFNKETKANEALILQLTERLKTQEDRMNALEKGIDLERRLRRLEQNKVHTLVLYIIELKGELRRHGIEVPTSGSMLHDDKDLAELLGLEGDEYEQNTGGPLGSEVAGEGN